MSVPTGPIPRLLAVAYPDAVRISPKRAALPAHMEFRHVSPTGAELITAMYERHLVGPVIEVESPEYGCVSTPYD